MQPEAPIPRESITGEALGHCSNENVPVNEGFGSMPSCQGTEDPSQADVVLEFLSNQEKHGHYSLSFYVCGNLRRKPQPPGWKHQPRDGASSLGKDFLFILCW